MPLEGVSQGFKDISASFKSHPLTNDAIALKNASAVARSVRNIVMTFPGEKPFQPTFGSKISKSLFENIDNISAITIRDEIENSIRRALHNQKDKIDTKKLKNYLLLNANLI